MAFILKLRHVSPSGSCTFKIDRCFRADGARFSLELCDRTVGQSTVDNPSQAAYSRRVDADMNLSIEPRMPRPGLRSRISPMWTPSSRGWRSAIRAANSTAAEIDVATRSARSSRTGFRRPSSCNHQNWHFVAVTDPALKKRARAISGGNHHFEFCSVLIYLCFQKGWTHDKFSIVQSVAGACYHMMLSAHLRGYRDDLERRHRRHRGGRRNARHSADIRDPGRAVHRAAEADARPP